MAADAGEDGAVDMGDLLILAQNKGSISSDWMHGDFNYDSMVDFNDLLILAQNIGKTNGNTPLAAELPAAATAAAATARPIGSPAAKEMAVTPLFSVVPIAAETSTLEIPTVESTILGRYLPVLT